MHLKFRIQHEGGVGVNTSYRIVSETTGRVFGQIKHAGYTGSPREWTIYDVYRSHVRTGIKTSAEAREIAVKLGAEGQFPTVLAAYVSAAKHAYVVRRRAMEDVLASELAEALRGIMAGSNSARDQAAETLKKIEDYALGLASAIKPVHGWNIPQTPKPLTGLPAWTPENAVEFNERIANQPAEEPSPVAPKEAEA